MAYFLSALQSAKPSLLASDMERLAPSVLSWRSVAALRQDREAWLDMQLSRCSDEAFGVAFWKGRPSPGSQSMDYLHRLVPLSGGGAFLGGIRFRGGGMPFVDILATTWGRGRWSEIWEAVEAEWAIFQPEAIRIIDSMPPTGSGMVVERDQFIIAGQLANIARMDPALNEDRVTIRQCAPHDALSTIESGFSTLPPRLLERVLPADIDDLTSCSDSGVVAEIMIDGAVAGVIAVREGIDYGVRGWEIVEEILLKRYRGQRYATAAQRSLVNLLVKRFPNAVLYGTIDGTNTASVRTALRAGRSEIASYWWLSRG